MPCVMWYWHSAVIAYYRQIRVPAWHSRPRLDDKVFISREPGSQLIGPNCGFYWPELWTKVTRAEGPKILILEPKIVKNKNNLSDYVKFWVLGPNLATVTGDL